MTAFVKQLTVLSKEALTEKNAQGTWRVIELSTPRKSYNGELQNLLFFMFFCLLVNLPLCVLQKEEMRAKGVSRLVQDVRELET